MIQATPSLLVALGHYRILRRLGYGGMSEIYLAYDERLRRTVALKVVDMAQEDHVQRFRCEVETLMKLSHEHILPVFDWGEQDGWCYYAMPHLTGGSLRDRLQQGLLTLEEAGSIFEQVASALHYAHEQGVLHRDIKPSNILFKDERHVYLADFGLARRVGQEGGITQTGCLIGTPEYVAPELASRAADQRSDIYALGVLLYKMLTGKVPFQAATPLALHLKHISERPIRPSSLNPAVALAVEHIILKALEKDPADRFHSAQQMAVAYRQSLRALRHPRTAREWSAFFSYWLRLSVVRAQAVVRLLCPKMDKRTGSVLLRLYHASTVCAMIVLLCVAPLCLGFSLSHMTWEQAESSISLQAAASYLDTQPLLRREYPSSVQGATLKSLSRLPVELPTSLSEHQYAPLQYHGTQGKQNTQHNMQKGQKHERGEGQKGHGKGYENGKGSGKGPENGKGKGKGKGKG